MRVPTTPVSIDYGFLSGVIGFPALGNQMYSEKNFHFSTSVTKIYLFRHDDPKVTPKKWAQSRLRDESYEYIVYIKKYPVI